MADETPEVRRLVEQLSSEGILWYWTSNTSYQEYEHIDRNDGPDYCLDIANPWIMLCADDQEHPDAGEWIEPLMELSMEL